MVLATRAVRGYDGCWSGLDVRSGGWNMAGKRWGIVSTWMLGGVLASLAVALCAPALAAESWTVTVRGHGEGGKGETPVIAATSAPGCELC